MIEQHYKSVWNDFEVFPNDFKNKMDSKEIILYIK